MNISLKSLTVCMFCMGCLSYTALNAQSANTAPQLLRLDASMNANAESVLNAQGIEILHYYGDQTYLLSDFPKGLKTSRVELPSQKEGQAGDLDFTTEEVLNVELVLAFPEASAHLTSVLAKAGFTSSSEQVKGGTTLIGTVQANRLVALLANPLILDATPQMDDFVPYHLEGRIAQGVTPLNSGIAGAPDLNGEGVVFGIGDGGALSGHPDIGDRVIQTTTYYNPGWYSHPDMVAGIMAGTGSVYSDHRGVACEAELVIEPSSGIVYRAPNHLNDFQMTITNNSYGPSYHCNTANKYYGTCASVDQQLFDNPSLLHVYAVGNSGGSSCNGQPIGYSNIPGGGQVAKNSLSVGNAQFDRTRNSGSSAGPTFDGRLKPEIMAIGSSVTSNNRSGSYSTGSGTSYSSPGAAATLGLLTQRYKEIHNGNLPDGALLKAIACNTAEDIGPAGPDFQHGFGLIDGVKALYAIENSTYHQGFLGAGIQYTQSLATTSTTERLKIMLYWSDQAGSTTNTTSTLVNDFDLKVVTPAGDTLKPWVLDPLNPASLAVRGTDTLNNIEQVTVDAPTAGAYIILVDGKTLPYGSTDFVLSWVIQEPEVLLTCPFGGESFNTNDTMYVAWDASPGQTGTWKVEYNLDGATWQTVASGVESSTRHVKWGTPAASADIEFRVTNESTLLFDETNEPALVLGKPENVVGASMCDGGVLLQWSPVSGASSYQVYKFDGSEMVAVGNVTDTVMAIGGLEEGVDSLFTVAAVSPSGKTSQRAYAIDQKSEVGGTNCFSPLPVEWVTIQAKALGSDVEIQWTVASEFENERFEVLRSTSGRNWSVVHRIDGRGTEPTAKAYSFVDTDVSTSGITYYRVKQVDFDGAYELSDIVSHVSSSDDELGGATISLLENPIRNTINLNSNSLGDVEVGLYDLAGREVTRFHVRAGLNSISVPAGLNAGMYVLQSNTPQGVESLKLVKW